MTLVHVRDAGSSPEDAAFIVEAFDSTLPHLAAIGSGEMWGSQPFSEKDGFIEETIKDVDASKKYQLTGEGEALHIFVAEVECGTPADATPHPAGLRYRTADDGTRLLSVGAAFVRENWLPSHVKAQFDIKEIRDELDGRGDFVFLDVLVTDYRAHSWRRGAGEALIRAVREYGTEKGMKVLYLDAWNGNGGKLVRFYQQHGFALVADFEMRRGNGTTWPGTLLRMDLVV